jgi:hypothetical protein
LRRAFFYERSSRAACAVRVHPRREILGAEVGKEKEEIGHVAFGIQNEKRNVGEERLLEQVDAETGLPAAGHSNADPVRDEIAAVVEKRFRVGDGATEIEVAHGMRV